MPRVEGEDAFMASLLADLDADVFTSPPASQALPSRPPSQSHSRGLSQRPRPLKRSAPSSSQPRPQPLTPRKRAARPTAAAEPEPFWADPLARPLMSQGALARRDEAERAGGFAPGVERERGVVKKARRATEQGCGAGGEGTGEVRRVKRVEIGLEGKENAERERRDRIGVVEVKREKLVDEKERDVKPVVDVALGIVGVKASAEGDEFDDLVGGVDWDEAMIGFDDELSVKTSGPHVPRCKQYARCTVEEIVDSVGTASRPQKILTVSSTAFEGVRQVLLCDDWVDTPVTAGDIVNLIDLPHLAAASSDTPVHLTRSVGLLVLHPDILVSSTKVADSSHCTRKAVLQELIRTLGGSSPSLLYGNMLHALLQSCMTDGKWDDEYRFERIDEIVKENGGMLWELEMSFDKVRLELRERSKEFQAFAKRFSGSKPKADAFLSDPRALDTARSRLAITSTLGVEDDIWSPRFGLKGKIDVSTQSAVVDSVGFTRRGTTPFEIKTGRTSAGMEHRAQTMLYTLLMSDRYGASLARMVNCDQCTS
ncbi:DNA replication factor Dna2-domain-containing protein [Rhodotorula diobovata]|uniref:DNA replication factor Dna2-domain-containing protein n=1 Tax=Rhodotorula diobovata TaxID=5288 RepID=A0A5C5G452_9BASI|nr:DNA replication factor Dna2-domain-containing protein [Rhodotorula diobovata]